MSKFDLEQPIEVMKKTTDDWYPNYPNDMVRLVYVGRLNNGFFRISVWGADDCGYEFDTEDEEKAKKLFEFLKRTQVIRKSELRNLGFRQA